MFYRLIRASHESGARLISMTSDASSSNLFLQLQIL